jgi:hypothetical protein
MGRHPACGGLCLGSRSAPARARSRHFCGARPEPESGVLGRVRPAQASATGAGGRGSTASVGERGRRGHALSRRPRAPSSEGWNGRTSGLALRSRHASSEL